MRLAMFWKRHSLHQHLNDCVELTDAVTSFLFSFVIAAEFRALRESAHDAL